MEFIVSIIFIYLIFRLILWIGKFFLLRSARKHGFNTENNENDETGETDRSQKQKKKKVFNQSDGEYVDFEEVNKNEKQI